MTLAPLPSLGRFRSFQLTLRSSQRRYAIKPAFAGGNLLLSSGPQVRIGEK